jgi:hypothetical protein
VITPTMISPVSSPRIPALTPKVFGMAPIPGGAFPR